MWFASLLFAVAADVSDADARILVVAPTSVRAQDLYRGLRGAGLLPVELDERSGVDLPVTTPLARTSRDDARARLQDSRIKMRELDTAGALRDANAAVDTLLRLEHPQDARDLWIDVLLFRAGLLLTDGNPAAASADLVLVSRLDKKRTELHPGLYAPSVVAAYATARALGEAGPPARLIVRPRAANFAPTSVIVDGDAVQQSADQTTSADALLAGPHLVTARAEGVQHHTQIVDLNATTPTLLTPFLGAPEAAQRRAQLVLQLRAQATPQPQTLETLAALCAARTLLVETEAGTYVYTRKTGVRAIRPEVDADMRDANVVGRAALTALTRPVDPATEDGTLPTWFWASGALGVGVLILGSVAVGASLIATIPPPAETTKAPPRPVVVRCCVAN